jgi:hypothetical protein
MCVLFSVFADQKNGMFPLYCTGIMTIFWVGNISLWATDSIHYYIVTDALFAIGMGVMFYISRLRWIAVLMVMYCMNFGLDLLLQFKHLDYYWFAQASNMLFTAELIIASHAGAYGAERHVRTVMITFIAVILGASVFLQLGYLGES